MGAGLWPRRAGGRIEPALNTWKDKDAYDAQAKALTRLFEDNFQQFESDVDDKVKATA